jgi:hypothetical protein
MFQDSCYSSNVDKIPNSTMMIQIKYRLSYKMWPMFCLVSWVGWEWVHHLAYCIRPSDAWRLVWSKWNNENSNGNLEKTCCSTTLPTSPTWSDHLTWVRTWAIMVGSWWLTECLGYGTALTYVYKNLFPRNTNSLHAGMTFHKSKKFLGMILVYNSIIL